jgi:hypothetical protein
MRDEIQRQAKELAIENRKAEPDVEKVLWFPDDEQVRLVVVTPLVPISLDGDVHPFYFRADPGNNLPATSGIALIRPDEVGKLRLPRKWGDWPAAIVLE